MTDGSTTLKLNDVLKYIKNASHDDMVKILLEVLSWFKLENLGNPFNYNRGFEFIQAHVLGFKLEPVGGGSDGVSDDGITAEFKATEWKGLTKRGKEKSHSFTYNGTTKVQTIEEQEKVCYKKVMRDDYHYWTIVDYEAGNFLKTLKVKNTDVWSLIWGKWKSSFYNSATNADGRIGGCISTNELTKHNIKYEIISHQDSGGVLM